MLVKDEIKIKLKEIKKYLKFCKLAYIFLLKMINNFDEFKQIYPWIKSVNLKSTILKIEDKILDLETKSDILKRKLI